MSKDSTSEQFWTESWVQHIEEYLAAPPRCGIWLTSRFHLKGIKVLEVAGGSCRDSNYLFSQGVYATGSDFEEKTLEYLRRRSSQSGFILLKQDARSFGFKDKSFELTFCNGFWIYFASDKDIQLLLSEQARITKKVLISMVHNNQNPNLVAVFKRKAQQDNLYKIRFFSREELRSAVRNSKIHYKKFSIEKFGGPADLLFAIEKRFKYLSGLVRWLVPRLYRFQPWSMVERIVLVIELE